MGRGRKEAAVVRGSSRDGGVGEDGEEGKGKRGKERNPPSFRSFCTVDWLSLSPPLSLPLSLSPAMSRLRWMPCHPVISPYQPRNCLETSTALSDDAQLLSSFRVPRIIFDRSADRSAIVGEGMGRGF